MQVALPELTITHRKDSYQTNFIDVNQTYDNGSYLNWDSWGENDKAKD